MRRGRYDKIDARFCNVEFSELERETNSSDLARTISALHTNEQIWKY